MNTGPDIRTLFTWLKIIGIAVIVLVALFFGTKQCNAQYAGGTFQLSQPYQAIHDEIMTAKYGEDWEADMQKELREHLRNRLSEAREAYRKAATDAVALEDEQLELLTPQERNAVNNAQDVLREAAKRIKTRRDSLAAIEAEEIGHLIIGPDGHRGRVLSAELIGANIGKAYHAVDFTRWPEREQSGGGGGIPTSTQFGTGGNGAYALFYVSYVIVFLLGVGAGVAIYAVAT